MLSHRPPDGAYHQEPAFEPDSDCAPCWLAPSYNCKTFMAWYNLTGNFMNIHSWCPDVHTQISCSLSSLTFKTCPSRKPPYHHTRSSTWQAPHTKPFNLSRTFHLILHFLHIRRALPMKNRCVLGSSRYNLNPHGCKISGLWRKQKYFTATNHIVRYGTQWSICPLVSHVSPLLCVSPTCPRPNITKDTLCSLSPAPASEKATLEFDDPCSRYPLATAKICCKMTLRHESVQPPVHWVVAVGSRNT